MTVAEQRARSASRTCFVTFVTSHDRVDKPARPVLSLPNHICTEEILRWYKGHLFGDLS